MARRLWFLLAFLLLTMQNMLYAGAVLPQGAFLEYSAFYTGASYQGGTSVVVNNFTDSGTTTIRVTGLNMTGPIGTFYLPGLPVTLVSGQDRIMNMTVSVPNAAYVGNRTVRVVVTWQAPDPQTGVWINGPPIDTSGGIPVLGQPPTIGPKNSNNPPNVSRTGNTSITSFYGIASFLILPGLAVYVALVAVAGILLLARMGRGKPLVTTRLCGRCGTQAALGSAYCGTCGARLQVSSG